MAAASFFGGLLKGFNARSAEARKEARDAQDAQDAKEDRYLAAMLRSDDEEVRNDAIMAMGQKASGAKPPKGGFLAGLMGGKTEVNPGVQTLMTLVNSIANGTAGPAPGSTPPAAPMPTNGFTPSQPPPMSGAGRGTSFGVPPPKLTLTEAMAPQGFTAPSPATMPTGSAAMAPPPSPGSLNPQVAAQTAPPAGQGMGPHDTGGPLPAQAGVGAPPPPVSAAPAKTPPATMPGGPISFGPRPAGSPRPPLPGTVPTPPRQILRSSSQKMMDAAKAPLLADIDVLQQLNTPEMQARMSPADIQAIRQKIGGRSATAGRDTYREGEIIRKGDGSWVQVLYNQFDPTDRFEIPATDPAMKSVAAVGPDAQLATRMFGSRFPGLTPNQVLAQLNTLPVSDRQAFYAEQLKRNTQMAFASGTGTGQAGVNTALAMPVGVTGAQSTPSRDPRAPLGGVPQVGRPLPDAEVTRLTDLQMAINEADTLAVTLNGVEGGTGAAAQLEAMLPNFVTDFTGWGTSAKQRLAVINRVKQMIGKSLEGGVLRKEDEIKYKEILPTIGDAPEVAASKLAGLKARLLQEQTGRHQQLKDAGFLVGTPSAGKEVEWIIVNGQLVRKGG